MSEQVTNAKQMPMVVYGLHFCEGIAEYAMPNGKSMRVFVSGATAKAMDPTFPGKPLFVMHVDKVDLNLLEQNADGYVAESFFNKLDGKHWAKIILVSDRAHEAYRKGWKLSNAYKPIQKKGGGQWHNVDYQEEIASAEYTHMALVPDPRYEESIILTPEEFKSYNDQKEQELKQFANSKETRSMLKFFKRSPVDNSADIENMSVTLQNGKELLLKDVIAGYEQISKKLDQITNEGDMCNMESMVAVGEEKMPVKDLVEKYQSLLAEKSNASAGEDEEAKKKALELAAHEQKELDEKKNAEAEAAKKKEEEEKQNAKRSAEGKKHFDTLKNAKPVPMPVIAETGADKADRGRQRYGSAK